LVAQELAAMEENKTVQALPRLRRVSSERRKSRNIHVLAG
jgi:hypothetical protein